MDYARHWNTVLQTGSKSATDIIASVTENALNRYLSEHHGNDTTKYVFEIERVFSLNPDRKFKLTVKVQEPLVIDLPPFAPLEPPFTDLFEPKGWLDVEEKDSQNLPSTNPFLKAKDAQDNEVTIRIKCPALKFTMEWSRLNAPGNWEWTPDPIAVVAEAKLQLSKADNRWIIRIMPTRLKFNKASRPKLKMLARKAHQALSKDSEAPLDDTAEKFYDLLLIALNVVGTEYAPRMVKNIEIPVPTINEKPVWPSFFDSTADTLTIGASLDTEGLMTKATALFSTELAKLRTYIQDDIDAKGGIDAMVLATRSPREGRKESDLVYRPKSDIRKDFVRTNEYLKKLRADARAPLSLPTARRKRAAKSAISEGLAVAVNEYFFEALINGQLPRPESACSDWESILAAVRGRTCHWSDIHGFDLGINGVTLSGTINVRVGGALEGCIKKFWDCSWEWACTRLALGVKGTPRLILQLAQSNNGVAFDVRVQGNLDLESNLPFPFNHVLSFYFRVIETFVEAFVNLILSMIRIQIIAKEIKIPDQRTRLFLSKFTPFPFDRIQRASLPPERLKFIGYKVDVDAGI